jgi:hypothetical protein
MSGAAIARADFIDKDREIEADESIRLRTN